MYQSIQNFNMTPWADPGNLTPNLLPGAGNLMYHGSHRVGNLTCTGNLNQKYLHVTSMTVYFLPFNFL